mgnify:CR=1 FL=1
MWVHTLFELGLINLFVPLLIFEIRYLILVIIWFVVYVFIIGVEAKFWAFTH